MSRILQIERVEGDEGPPVECEFPGLNLTGYSISMHIEYENGLRVSRAATLTNPTAGLFSVDFVAGDLVRGTHFLEFEFTPPSGPAYTLPRKNRGGSVLQLVVRRDHG